MSVSRNSCYSWNIGHQLYFEPGIFEKSCKLCCLWIFQADGKWTFYSGRCCFSCRKRRSREDVANWCVNFHLFGLHFSIKIQESFPSSQECDPDWDVSDLKWELERFNKIPEAEQRLLLDTRVLSDKVGWDGLGWSCIWVKTIDVFLTSHSDHIRIIKYHSSNTVDTISPPFFHHLQKPKMSLFPQQKSLQASRFPGFSNRYAAPRTGELKDLGTNGWSDRGIDAFGSDMGLGLRNLSGKFSVFFSPATFWL